MGSRLAARRRARRRLALVGGMLVVELCPFVMASARTTVSVCPPARYLLPPDVEPLLVGTDGAGAVVIGTADVAIETGCAPVPARRLRATRAGTRVVAAWPVCGDVRRVRLQAQIVDDCRALVGTRRARGRRPRRFIAARSECGDGIVDGGNGEACDGGACSGGTCDRFCRCVPTPSTSTSTTTTSTSTSVTVTTLPPECAALCGDGVIDDECAEDCDGDDVDAECPDGAVLDDCPRCTAGCRVDLSCCPTTTSTSVTTSTSSSTSTTVPVRFARDVLPILTGRCAQITCHLGPFPASSLTLTAARAWAELVDAPSVECPGKRVAPGDPGASYLVAKLAGAGPCFSGSRMPLLGPTLDDAEMALVRRWILAGAPND